MLIAWNSYEFYPQLSAIAESIYGFVDLIDWKSENPVMTF